MSKIKYILQFVRNPKNILIGLLNRYGHVLSDESFLRCQYYLHMGKKLNLNSPQTFSEKLQWLKLYDRNPLYTTLVDKYLVKDYVAKIIGEKYVIPSLGVWNSFDEIDFSELPDRFVLKTTHGGGSTGVVICKNKKAFDVEAARKKLNKSMCSNIYDSSREWPYKDVSRRIIAEQYIEPASNMKDLTDYKWFCFGGNPKYCQVIQNRSTDETIDFFDIEWKHQEFVGLIGLNSAYDFADVVPNRPENLDIHIQIARELSRGIPFARIDIYDVDGRLYFGEITFYPAGGFGEFRPSEYNKIIGEMLPLS